MRAKNIEDILVYMHTGQWFGFGGKEKTYANLIIHSDDEKPTQEWLETELKSQQDAYDNDISRKRKEEYPSIEECVHAILDDDLVALQEKRTAVKTKYPKA
jgi:hypothetical protein